MGTNLECKTKNFLESGKEELYELREKLWNEYEMFKKSGVSLDMSRGKPSREQVDLSRAMLDCIKTGSSLESIDGTDCGNYGNPFGIVEAKKLIAPLMGVDEDDVIIGNGSSLKLMFDTISLFMIHGISGCKPWAHQGKIKFLCPCPGYDRHFKISEYFNMELVPVKMTPAGPDMDTVERLVSLDPAIKGIWCVPKYSNPQGITYSDQTVRRFARLKPASPDFRIMWDNAYSVHSLTANDTNLLNLMDECEEVGSENLPIMFSSTSKITFPGSGICAVGCRKDNLQALKMQFSVQSVCCNKLNQLRHARFLKNSAGIRGHMELHKKILYPKFKLAIDKLRENFSCNPIVKWDEPKGGYFISLYTTPGHAKAVVELCKHAGLILTPAGATYPYGIDPTDSNIRLAPSYPSLPELSEAMDLFCLACKIVFIDKLSEK